MTKPPVDFALAPARRPAAISSLPPDLVEQSCRRVAIAALAFAALWGIGILLGHLATRAYESMAGGMGAVWPMPGTLVAAIGIAMSLTTAWIATRSRERARWMLDVGLLFLVATGGLAGFLANWRPVPLPTYGVSWLCIVVLVYPAIAPNTPARTLAAAVATVSMDPLFYLLAAQRGVVPPPTFAQLVVEYLPGYLCAFLSIAPLLVIRHLGGELMKARELGSYRLGGVLASGGMGEVYRAQHRLLVRPAAIKVIRPELLGWGAGRRIAVERFRREAQAAAVLQSPHTIALYDFGATTDGAFYYAMELLDGPSFQNLVERFGPVGADRAINLTRQACESLAEAHTRGLIHRDIKPSNLVASRLGLQVDFVKVLDFGLVKFGQQGESTDLTSPGNTTGTPAFMAPEVALGERRVDHRVDIYSLGCVLYWLLTGQLVFDAESPMRVMQQHAMETPVPPSQRAELPIPAELDEIVMACLAKQPADRPQTAHALSERLNAVPVPERWTSERARRWWDTHLPDLPPTDDGLFDQGRIVRPRLST